MNPFVTPHGQQDLVLASRSPRRAGILRGLGFDFIIDPAPESLEDGVTHDDPFVVPGLLAVRKCAHVAARHPGALVLAADTVVIVDGEILNKPADDAQACAFLRRLAGRAHTVVTGVALRCDARGVALAASERTRVSFRNLDDGDIERYVATGEGRDKAGSYAAQGVGAGLIRSVEGCFFNVVGLPVARVLDMLREVQT
ncbi:MAG TPA: Maf family protein [Candidatus Krumholzibacteria bacterium]|nr:Maf family protein [Candidatus Krumholzibacteria bacterium]